MCLFLKGKGWCGQGVSLKKKGVFMMRKVCQKRKRCMLLSRTGGPRPGSPKPGGPMSGGSPKQGVPKPGGLCFYMILLGSVIFCMFMSVSAQARWPKTGGTGQVSP